ncbi:MAG: transposase, partial [Desulfobulbus sp.]|nr:transposase [Desulfobulbus sp.]
LAQLMDKQDHVLHADSAYQGHDLHKTLLKNNPGLQLQVNGKRRRNHPLAEEQKANNKEKSRTRARVEHVFGHMTNSFGAMAIRTIGPGQLPDRAEEPGLQSPAAGVSAPPETLSLAKAGVNCVHSPERQRKQETENKNGEVSTQQRHPIWRP